MTNAMIGRNFIIPPAGFGSKAADCGIAAETCGGVWGAAAKGCGCCADGKVVPTCAGFVALCCAAAPANVASVDCPCAAGCGEVAGGWSVDCTGMLGGKIGSLAAGTAACCC